MGRTRQDIMKSLTPDERADIDARVAELSREIEGLKALRRLAKRSQEQIAHGLGVTQPAVHKMERQADLYLSTLRRFVEAAGGVLELKVELPGHGAFSLTGLGDLVDDDAQDGAREEADKEPRAPRRRSGSVKGLAA